MFRFWRGKEENVVEDAPLPVVLVGEGYPGSRQRPGRERVSGKIKNLHREANPGRTKRVGFNPRLTLFATIGLLLVGLIAAFFEGWTALDFEELWQTVASPEKLQAFFGSFGLWAPIVFALIQAAQVVISAVPAAPITLAGVAAFGPWMGFGLSLFGAVAGSVAAFLLGRRLGRPMVKRIVGEKVLERYAGKMSPDGLWVLVALMVPLPAGGDVVCAVAGLSKMSLRRFTIIVSLGRIPYTALAVLTASGLTTGSPRLLAGAFVVLSLLILAALLYTRRAKNDATREHKKVGTNVRVTSGNCHYREEQSRKKVLVVNLASSGCSTARLQDQLLGQRTFGGITGLPLGPPVTR